VLDPERQLLLQRLTQGLDSAALMWVSGYAAALAASQQPADPRSAAAQAARSDGAVRASVLYASQTGNGRRIAEKLARSLESQGLATRLLSLGDYPVRELAQERLVYLVASTHGDGDPPDDARAFVDFLFGRRAPRLERLAFSVLALGDSSYPRFCEIGRRLDERFAELGARRTLPRVDCDLDFDKPSAAWAQQAVEAARSELQAPHLAIVTSLHAPPASSLATRDDPVETEVLVNQPITARASDHLVNHLELLAPSDRLAYEPGDSLGVWQVNPRESVERLLELLKLDPAAPVEFDSRTLALGEWLAREREVTRLTRPFVEAHARRSGAADALAMLDPGNGEALRRVLEDWQVADLLKRYPAEWTGAALVGALRPLAPRLYSIASSPREVGEEVHITVAAVDYLRDGERRFGAASRYLSTRLRDGAASAAYGTPGAAADRVRVYIEPNQRFRLPQDASRDIIMVGPGTGVAPFRAFVQDRAATGATGRNWLFFGARHFDSDFLYQAEWLEARRRGSLHRLDVAFSRDQQHKVYVQHRMQEQGADLYAWLEAGAFFYVCGDAKLMAIDVHEALINVVERHGGLEREAAVEYVNALASERRYLRDVY
jgi:sulfite reductase (NADPH) flavoprotein alpha-component